MVYNKNKPQAGDDLSESQVDMQQNFLQANTSFGIDHVKFDDTSGDTGKHNSVTTPNQGADLSTSADELKIYATEAFTGGPDAQPLQFSRGESDAVPTPITMIHGDDAIADGGDVDVLDFNGATRALAKAYAFEPVNNFSCEFFVYYDGTNLTTQASQNVRSCFFQVKGGNPKVLNLKKITGTSSSPTFYWSIQFIRLV